MSRPPSRDPLSEGVSYRRREWDGVAAIIAAFVGLLALTVSGYTAWLQRQQVRAQVWPYLEAGISSSERDVTIVNKGSGPAIIHSVQVYVDDKPQPDWKTAFLAGGLDFGHHVPYSTLHGRVISSGEKVRQLVFPSDEDFAAFTKQGQRFKLRFCYCSALNECWQYDEREKKSADLLRDTGQCPAESKDDFTQ